MPHAVSTEELIDSQLHTPTHCMIAVNSMASVCAVAGHGFHGNRIYKIECTFVDAFFSDLSLSRMWVLSPNPGMNEGGCIILS